MAHEHALDQPWRIWASVAVIAILLSGVLIGIVIIPVVQGRSAGLDAWSAICRAVGINAGSPAVPQPVNTSPPSPVSQVKWTPDLLQVLARGDPKRGEKQAIDVCAPCHGDKGTSSDPQFPHMNGQSGAAIYKQLHDFRSGSRVNEQMTPIAQGLDENALADVAAYFAGQPKRNPLPSTLADPGPHIWQLIELGDPARALPACSACHRDGSGGPIETPVLYEQRYEYIVAQLKDYASGARRNDVYARMRTIAAKLTAEEINGVARYYASGLR